MNLITNNGEDLCKIVSRLDRSFMKFIRRNWVDSQLLLHQGQCWPNAFYFEVKRKSENYENNGVKNHDFWLGGSFIARYPIHVKHKIKYLSKPETKNTGLVKNMIDVRVLLFSWLSNKLNITNENQ